MSRAYNGARSFSGAPPILGVIHVPLGRRTAITIAWTRPSRVIGAFEGTIDKLVALAALMPIIASVGGNTGNQTAALLIRGLALDQIGPANLSRFLLKELGIGLMNGLIWGTVVGLFALAIYARPSLAGLMAGAMALNLAIASVSEVLIPYGLHKLGRDPVMGSSVFLTAITDSMGFFIFLGLAALFLV